MNVGTGGGLTWWRIWWRVRFGVLKSERVGLESVERIAQRGELTVNWLGVTGWSFLSPLTIMTLYSSRDGFVRTYGWGD